MIARANEQVMDIVLSCAAVLFAALLVFFLFKFCYQPFGLYKKYGIPGPTPLPFIGNFLLLRKLGVIGIPAYLRDKYGPVCGIYVGCRSFLIVADIDILKKVYVDNFEIFTEREVLPEFFNDAVGLPQGLFMARGNEWRRSRKAVAPAFSAKNMRMVASNIIKTCEKLSSEFQAHADSMESVQVNKLVEEFVMEGTVSMVFGDMGDSHNKEKKIFVKCAKELWGAVDETTVTLLWFTLGHFPWMGKVIGLLMTFTSKGQYYRDLYRACSKMVTDTSTTVKKNKTIIQLLLEAEVEENGGSRKMTNKEIVSQLITFLMAGLETVSTTVSCTAYLLALNPDVQQKAHEKIEAYFHSKPDASLLEVAQELEYMEMVIQEALRFYPPAVGIGRLCNETIEINGVTIPAGVTVYGTVREIQRDPRYWHNPEKFIPERFTAEEKAKRPSTVYMPFGVGPRNCVGARFAMLEVKMMLIQTLRTLKFVQAPDTQVPLKLMYRVSVSPSDGVSLRVASW
ncbi:cytochrome P450 3A4-like [Halichondria panicea]|uniref:cytochrome P450 3A4-like n=1 Tax=Halichondria panicea TaxID=6063 RepID=UPI00312B2F66